MKKSFTSLLGLKPQPTSGAKIAGAAPTAGSPEAATLSTLTGESENNNNGFSEEIQLAIFSMLDNPHDLANASYVSKTWKRISDTPVLWEHLGFMSQKDFNQRKKHFDVKQTEAAIKICKNCQKDASPLVYLLGDTDFQNQLFGKTFELFDPYGIQHGNKVFRWRAILLRSGSLILCQNKKSSPMLTEDDIPASLDIALVAVKTKKEMNRWIKLFLSRPTVLLLFAIPTPYLKNFAVMPFNAIPLFEKPLGTFYAELFDKLKQLRGERTKKHCLVS